MLSKDEFVEWGKNYVLFLHVTSHVEGDPYPDLLAEKGGTGFPTLVFMDPDGNVIARHLGPRSVEGFTKTAEEARKNLDLKRKAEAGDPKAQVEWFLTELRMGAFDPKAARSRLNELLERAGGEAPWAAEAKGLITDREVQVRMRAAYAKTAKLPPAERSKSLTDAVVSMFEEGLVPRGRSGYGYMIMLSRAAIAKGDPKFAAAVREAVGKFLKNNPAYRRIFKRTLAKLDEIGAKPGGR